MGNQISCRKFQRRNQKKFILINCIGLVIIAIGYFAPIILFIGILLEIGFLFFSLEYLQKANTWKLGAEGEEKVAKELEKLGEDYKIFHDIPLYERFEIKSNIDHLVVGKNGIFLIETKNHNGIITCNGDEWTQDKVGRLGTAYKGKLRWPSRQVKRNSVLLKELIQDHYKDLSYRLWINPVLVFTNEEAKLNINNPTVPVLRLGELESFIENYKSDIELKQENIDKVSEIIGEVKKT